MNESFSRQHMNEAIAQARRNDLEEDPIIRVYFVQESGVGAIKIGVSRNLPVRLGLLKADNPHEIKVLGTIAGGYSVESHLHFFFRYARIRGEWFRPVPELLEYICEIDSTTRDAEKKREEAFEKLRNMKGLVG